MKMEQVKNTKALLPYLYVLWAAYLLWELLSKVLFPVSYTILNQIDLFIARPTLLLFTMYLVYMRLKPNN